MQIRLFTDFSFARCSHLVLPLGGMKALEQQLDRLALKRKERKQQVSKPPSHVSGPSMNRALNYSK